MRPEHTVLDLFSGIGGFSLGLAGAGFQTIAFCESDAFCRDILARRFPGIPVHDDIRRLRAHALRPFLVCGGFPCQDASLAGRGAGLDGARTGLWRDMARIVGECRPRWVVAENVPGLRSRGADRVCSDLEAIGYRVWPLVVGAVHAGAPHRRRRVFIVGRGDTTNRAEPGDTTRRAEPGDPTYRVVPGDATYRAVPGDDETPAHAPGAGLEMRQPRPARAAARLQPQRCRGWDVEPGLRRVVDGFPRTGGPRPRPRQRRRPRGRGDDRPRHPGRGGGTMSDATRERVMIVEDEALVALTLEDVLLSAGHHVCCIADRPDQALDYARAHPVDVAVIDVRLAGGGDGIALALQLAALGSMMILFATGNPAEVRERAKVGHGCLTKPFEGEWLVEAIAAIRDGREPVLPGYFPLPIA